MEIWNNVFSQFNNDGNGNYTELAQKNIDTGMGLERLACVMQGVDNMFEVDTIRKILDTVCTIAGKTYGADKANDISIRVCTDHIKSSMFMIADGVIPSNEGRGYVLRRIIRRACRHGKLLGIDRPFLVELCEVAIGENVDAYPELGEKQDYIKKVISIEEERFDATIDSGLSILSDMIEGTLASGSNTLSGDDAFKLYDTYGFPLDLTREIAEEKGLAIDEEGFTALMQEQRTRARAARGNISGWSDSSKALLNDLAKTEFTGYGNTASDAKVLAIIVDDMLVDEVSEGDFTLILDKTPFYGEGGGQVGDTGLVTAENATVQITDTKKAEGIFLHMATVQSGAVRVGDAVKAEVDAARRAAIMRNHSSLHLLQAALRQVLGTHVEQAGSYVDEQHGRFDFTHFAALTAEEIAKVEAIVNANILSGVAVDTVETDIESAKKMGAMMLFGEKYGATVRVVKMGDCSTEFCGGTHVDNTAKVGLFRIVSEASVASGVRRIEAVTGANVLTLLDEKDKLLADTAKEIKAQNVTELVKRSAAVMAELKEQKREIDALNSKLAATKMDAILAGAVAVKSVKLTTANLGAMQIDVARTLADEIKAQNDDMVAVLAVCGDGKLNFIAVAGKNAVAAGAHAGKLVGAVAAITGGKGGGRPDNAMAGGRDADKIDTALAEAASVLDAQIR